MSLPVDIGLHRRERRWLVIFLVLGSAYFGVLLLRFAFEFLGGFSQIFLLLFLAWLLAFVMSPVIGFLQREFSLPRGLAVAISYVLALVALGFVLFYIGASITQQVADLTRTFPQTAASVERTLASWQQSLGLSHFQIDLVGLFKSAQSQFGGLAGAIFASAQVIAGATLAALGSLVLILILSLYMLLDSDRILGKLNRVVPSRYSDELQILEQSIARAFGGFLRAQIVLAVLQAAIVTVVGITFGVPYLFLVGTLSALAMLIPFFGPPIALIPPIVAAWIYHPEWVVVIAIVLIGVQTVIVNWLQPRLMQGALGIPPILVLVGLLVGAQVAGVWGALFGIPVIAVLNVLFNYLFLNALPNVALPERERLENVGENTMVTVEKGQIADDTHPRIHVHRSLREDGSEEVRIDVDQPEPEGNAPG
ncbi:MAG: AI-2E family transporter [Chloroflexota bacterium]|nr:AI-2E family transporter [Chloroflexota bacterium]